MKIGAMANSFNKRPQRVFDIAKNIGVQGLQITISKGYYDVDKMTERKKSLLINGLVANNLEVSAFCGDLGGHGFMVEKENAWRVEKSKRMVDFAASMDVNVITTHIGVIPEDKSNPRYAVMQKACAEIGKYAATKGVTFAVETGPETAPVLYDFIKDLEGVGVNLDPANFVMITGQDPVEAVKLLAKKIVHTHAKDGKNLQRVSSDIAYGVPGVDRSGVKGAIYQEVPLGQGSVDFPKYIAALKEIGYNGYLTIERECGRKPIDDISMAVGFLRDILGVKKVLNIAVIGCGSIANNAHFPSIKATPNIKIRYCVDIVIDRAKKAAEKFGTDGYTKVSEDYHDALNDPEVDAVLICTHTFLHAKIAIEAMRAGKHSFSEKPVAMTYAEAEELASVAHETGKVCNIGVCMRFDGAVNVIKRLIDQGVLGNIYNVYCSFRAFRSVPGIGGEFTNIAHSGGGVLFDWGVHYLDLIMYILGSPDPKTATCSTYLEVAKDIDNYVDLRHYARATNGERVCNVEEYVSGFVRLDGVDISLNGAWAQNIFKKDTFIDFLGDKGGVRMTYCGKFELFIFDKNGVKKFITKKPKIPNNKIYRLEFQAFADDIRFGNHSRAYVDNVMPTAKMLDALYKSAAEKGEIKL